MAKQVFGRNGQPAGTSSGGGGSGGGGNANVYITIPNVDIKDILLIGTQAKVKVSASTFDVDNSVVYFDLRIDNTQVLLDAVKDGKMWKAEYTFTVAGQSGDRLAIFCNAIDQGSLRSMTGTPAISPRLTESYIAAPVITSPVAGEYKTAGSIVIKGTEFVSLGAPDTQKAIHGRVVLADDPQVVRWEGSLAGALTQITASWVPAGEGQEDLLCSIAYEGNSSIMGEWSEPVLVKLVKSGVSVPVITWPLNGEKYADPNLLRVNAEQPTVKSNSWTGTEWQVSEFKDFFSLLVNKSIPDPEVLPNRVMTDLILDGRTNLHLYLRCRHLSNVGPTVWSAVVEFDVAEHQTFFEFSTTGSFTAPATGIYEVLCVGSGGTGGEFLSNIHGGGGGSGYIAVGNMLFSGGESTAVTINSPSTSVKHIIANNGSPGKSGNAVEKGCGGAGGNGGGGGRAASHSTLGGVGVGISGKGTSTARGGAGGGTGASKGGGDTASALTPEFCSYGYGAGGQGGNSTNYMGFGGGAGGYGGGKDFEINTYYSRHLPYRKFNNIVSTPTGGVNNQSGTKGYVRIIYKGPVGEGA